MLTPSRAYVSALHFCVKFGFKYEENECSGSEQRKDTIDEAVDKLFGVLFGGVIKEE